tara:strand:- start:3786 stop:3941 length:156 start_codon:yes stop_codon:yes gene_type:complete
MKNLFSSIAARLSDLFSTTEVVHYKLVGGLTFIHTIRNGKTVITVKETKNV